jgi:hypothetical protein
MRTLFLSLCAATVLVLSISSCQREVDNPTDEIVKPTDPNAISLAIKVWHGVRTKGIPPSPSNNPAAPQIDPAMNNQPIKAIAGRYAIIQPEVISGEVKGYYVGVRNSDYYFNVDFSKPRNAGRGLPVKKNSNILNRVNSLNDSALVIEIPSNIQPGTFCVTWCPYDSLGNVGQPITTCITVTSFGTDAGNAWLGGVWKVYATADTLLQNIEVINYGVGTEPGSTFYCENGFVTYFCNNPPCTPINLPDTISYNKMDLSLGINGGMRYEFDYWDRMVSEGFPCNSPYGPRNYDNDTVSGAWNYNAATRQMLLVFDLDYSGNPDPDAWFYNLTKVSNNEFILKDPSDDYAIIFRRR